MGGGHLFIGDRQGNDGIGAMSDQPVQFCNLAFGGKAAIDHVDDCRAAISEDSHHPGQLLLGPIAFYGVQDHSHVPGGLLGCCTVIGQKADPFRWGGAFAMGAKSRDCHA